VVKDPIMKDARAIPAFFPPGWLENAAHDPKLARDEIQHLSVRLRKVGTENREVREERDGLKRKLSHKNKQIETLHLELKLRDATLSRQRETIRSERLEYRRKQLDAALMRQEDGKAMSAIRKLSRDSTVSKRIAAAFHPDKVPTAMCEVATEMFRLVQNLREESAEKKDQ
jgi:hypothetical protein